MPFWRGESLHEKLAREAGMPLGPGRPEESEASRPSWDKAGIHGLARPREWDAVVTVQAEGVEGDRVEFTALPDGTLLVDEEVAEESLGPFADAVERELEPPYRAEAVRQDAERWAVAARAIDVVELPEHLEGEALQLVVNGEERTVELDGERLRERVPELEQLAPGAHDSYVTRAKHLDGALWEVEISPL